MFVHTAEEEVHLLQSCILNALHDMLVQRLCLTKVANSGFHEELNMLAMIGTNDQPCWLSLLACNILLLILLLLLLLFPSSSSLCFWLLDLFD